MPISISQSELDVGREYPLGYTQYLPEGKPIKAMLISSATAVYQNHSESLPNILLSTASPPTPLIIVVLGPRATPLIL